MTNELSANQLPVESPTTRLKQLAQNANEAHGRVVGAARYALVHAYEAGEALLQAKELCKARGWLMWLSTHFKGSTRTAQRYMEFAQHCRRLGGLDAAAAAHIAPGKAGHALARFFVESPRKKTKNPPAVPQQSLPRAAPTHAAEEPAAPPPPVAEAGMPTARTAQCAVAEDAAADPFPRFVALFEELLAGLEAVMNGDDCHDGPFAELLLMDLRPPFADLLEYLEDRKDLRRPK